MSFLGFASKKKGGTANLKIRKTREGDKNEC